MTGPSAFLATYAAAKRDAIDATTELLTRLRADPAVTADAMLKHAVELAQRAAKVDRHLAAQAAATATATGANDASGAGFGTLAYDLMLAWRRAERIAHLRAAAPTQPLLAAEAKRCVAETAAAWTALEAAMRMDSRLRVRHQKLVKWFKYVPRADATSSVLFDSAFHEIAKWLEHIELQFGAMAKDLDHPADAAPTAADRLAALGASNIKPSYGAPTEITIELDALATNALAIFAAAPITALHVRGGINGRAAELARIPGIERIVSLDLMKQGVTDADLAALLRAALPCLRSLDLTQNEITNVGVDLLAAATRLKLPQLEAVSLQLNRAADPIDQRAFTDDTTYHRVPTDEGTALEGKHGPLRWLHPRP